MTAAALPETRGGGLARQQSAGVMHQGRPGRRSRGRCRSGVGWVWCSQPPARAIHNSCSLAEDHGWTSGNTGWGLGAAANCMSYAPPGRKREREREPGRSASGTGRDGTCEWAGRAGRDGWAGAGSAADGSAEQSAERRVPVWCTELGVDRAGITETAKRRARAETGAMSVSVIGPSCDRWLESVSDGRRCD